MSVWLPVPMSEMRRPIENICRIAARNASDRTSFQFHFLKRLYVEQFGNQRSTSSQDEATQPIAEKPEQSSDTEGSVGLESLDEEAESSDTEDEERTRWCTFKDFVK